MKKVSDVKKIALMFFLGLFISAMLTSCVQPSRETESISDIDIQDRAGFDINVPGEIASIISMAPAITEVLIDLDLEEKLVAVDTQSADIMATNHGIPEFDMLNPDIESMVVLKPDIILASTMTMMGNEANDPFVQLKNMGICVAYIPSSESIDEIKADIRFISEAVGQREKGGELISRMEADMRGIRDMKDSSLAEKTVYFEISAAPAMYSFGKGVFLNEMLEFVGAKNIFADKSSWMPVEPESIVAANPDVIFTNVNYIDDPVGEILSRPGWENINAIKNGQVFYVGNSYTALPNHNIVKGMKEMARNLYGEEN